jgi:hypothetical protein
VLPILDTHQSYDDFRLDALLQYDLDDSECDGRTDKHIDHSSSHTSDLPIANFDDIYNSIPEIEYKNTTSQNMHLARSMSDRKLLRLGTSQRLFNIPAASTHSLSSDSDIFQKKSKKGGFIRSLGKLIQRPNQTTVSNTAMDHSNCKRGVGRKLSTRTEGTVLSCDDKSAVVTATCDDANDDSSSVCYIESDNNSYTLSEEWYNGMNYSTDTFESNDFVSNEMSKSDVSSRLYRSLPIIESRGMVSLLLDSDDDSECHAEESICDDGNNDIECHTDEKICGDSEKPRRRYSICDI